MAALLAMQINQAMLFLGIGLFVYVMINRLRRSFGKPNERALAGRSWQNDRRAAQQAGDAGALIGSARLRSAAASPEHESCEVEVHRLAREIKGEIDTKMRLLEELIQLADEASSRLDNSIERAKSLGLNGQPHGPTHSSARLSVEFGEASPISRSAQRTTNTKQNRERARSLPTTVGDDPGDDPRFERVYALADAGFSAAKIAGQIGSQVGEVELILSLRQSSEAA
jgi:hypothetical protein